MQVVVQHGETGQFHGKDFAEHLQAIFEPLFAVQFSFPQQEGAPHGLGNHVVPGRYGHIHQLRAGNGHRRHLLDLVAYIIPTNIQASSFPLLPIRMRIACPCRRPCQRVCGGSPMARNRDAV